MKKLSITKVDIDRIAENSKTGLDYLLNLYKFVINDFAKIKLVDGFPIVSTNTTHYIFSKVKFENESFVDFSLLWLNKGFASENDIPDFQVNLSKVKLIYNERATAIN